MKTVSAIIAVLLIASLGVGVVGAQEPDRRGFDRIGTILDAISSATGLSREDIIQMSQQEGKTLAEIITENGGDLSAVQAEIVAAYTADLNEQIDRLNERIGDLLNNPLPRPQNDGPNARGSDHPVLGALLGSLIEMSDLDGASLREQLGDGVTVAEIATGAGLDPQDVAADALAQFEERLNQAVENGRIQPEDVEALLADFSEQMDTYLNTPIPQIRQAQQQQATAGRALLQAAASVLNVQPREVLGAISPDQSLADYVSENGGDPAAVTDEARAQIATQIENAVTNNRLSQDEADDLLANLDGVLEEVLNAPGAIRPRPDSQGGRDGRGGRGQQND